MCNFDLPVHLRPNSVYLTYFRFKKSKKLENKHNEQHTNVVYIIRKPTKTWQKKTVPGVVFLTIEAKTN